MEFHGLSDEKIFEQVADAEPRVRFDALMHMGMNRNLEKIDEAISFYQSALELAGDESLSDLRLVAVRFLVNALRLAGQHEDAITLLDKELTLEQAETFSDDSLGRAMLEYAVTLAEQGKTESAIAKLEDAERFLNEDTISCALAENYNRVSEALYGFQHFQMAANIGQRARGFATDCGHTEVAGKAFYLVAKAYEALRMFDEALSCYKEADALLSHGSYGDDELDARLAIARIHWLRKDFEKSLNQLSELRSFALEVSYASKDLVPKIDLQAARSLFQKGDLQTAANVFYQARTILRAMKNHPWAAVAEAESATVHLAMGNVEDAIASAETAMRWFNEKADKDTELWVRLAYGKVMNATSNHDAALAVLHPEEPVDFSSDFEPHVQYRVELAEAMVNAGDSQAAAATAAVVLEFFDHVLTTGDRARLHAVLTEAAVARNDLPEALRCIALAIKNYAADFNSIEVNRLTERLMQIASGEANRLNNEVIDGL